MTIDYKPFLKKLTAILVLGVFLFNMGGYDLAFKYLIHQSDVQIVKKMYNEKNGAAKLIELKIPVHMPTIQDWTEYAHISGQIELNDGYYNYVGLKMTRDTMSLLCLPNHVKDLLVKGNLIVAKNLSDVPLGKKGPDPVSKKVDQGYDNVYQVIRCDYRQFAEQMKLVVIKEKIHTDHPYIESPGKPPNYSC